MPAFEGLDAGVDARVAVEVRLARERLGAEFAFERPFTRVNPNVSL